MQCSAREVGWQAQQPDETISPLHVGFYPWLYISNLEVQNYAHYIFIGLNNILKVIVAAPETHSPNLGFKYICLPPNAASFYNLRAKPYANPRWLKE